MTVRAPADRRFKRAHVRHARRRSWQSRVVAVLKALIALGVVTMATSWLWSAAREHATFTLRNIRVVGAVRMTTEDVAAVLRELEGRSIFRVSVGEVRERLRQSPWIRDATVRRVLPGTIEVAVQEREPIGLARLPGGLFLVDASGMVIDAFGPRYADLDLPLIEGLSREPLRPGEAADGERAALAERVLASVGSEPALARRLSQVDVSDKHNAVAQLADESALLHLGDERFLERLHTFVELAPALHERVEAIDYVDLRFDERVFLRPAAGAANADAARGGGKGRQANR